MKRKAKALHVFGINLLETSPFFPLHMRHFHLDHIDVL